MDQGAEDALDALFLSESGQRFQVGQRADLAQIANSRGLKLDAEGWLSRASWNKATPFRLQTERLTARSPREDELSALATIIDDPQIAAMLINLPHPISRDEAHSWWHKRRFSGRMGFQIGVFDSNGNVVGSVGLSALSNALVYFIARDHRRRGYATEIIAPFCRMAMARWDLCHVFAGVFQDNPDSREILERFGFLVTGSGISASLGRSEPAPFWEMRLTRN